MPRRCYVRLLILFWLLLVGCEIQSARPVAKLEFCNKVTGRITLDGEPLENARVLFIPVVYAIDERQTLPLASGVTDQDGRFELSHKRGEQNSPGAALGLYSVLVSKPVAPLETKEPAQPEESKAKEKLGPNQVMVTIQPDQIPERYNLKTTLPAKITSASAQEFEFELKKKP